jgi:DNA-binding CsgD family transcriptional regulator
MMLGSSRERERDQLHRILEDVRKGRSAALVLSGEAGIGKTTLLDCTAEAAADMRVLRVRGVESEMELAFAGLFEMLTPVLDRLHRLPDAQRRAITSALGLTDGASGGPANPFLVRLAALMLLADVAREQPLLCVADDAQWLDRESVRTLGFVARRLDADRVGMLFAVREPGIPVPGLENLPELCVARLSAEDARRLLLTVTRGRLGPLLTERILAEAAGNPLALAELGGELTQADLASTSSLAPLPLPAKLEEHFLQRVRALPPEAQTILLIAAAATSGDPAAIMRAADREGVSRDVADTAGLDRLLRFTPRVEFRHPLIRSAVYQSAPGSQRRRAHRVLAEAEHAPDRRAWHLAQAAIWPDEEVAAQLESSAERARDHGGWAASAAFLARAAVLTPDPDRRSTRLLRAAHSELVAGAPATALERLEEAMPMLIDPRQHAEAQRLLAWVRFELGAGASTAVTLLGAAQALRQVDEESLASQILLEAWEAAFYSGEQAGEASNRHIAMAIAEGTSGSGTARALLDGLSAVRLDYTRGVKALRSAIAEVRAREEPNDEYLQRVSLAIVAACELWDEEAMDALAARGTELARTRGSLTNLLTLLRYQALVEQSFGRYPAAEAAADEARTIAAATGNVGVFGSGQVIEFVIAARRGPEARARALAEEATRASIERGQLGALGHVRAGLAVLDISLGNYEDAVRTASGLFNSDPFWFGTAVLPDLVEAASRAGETDLATAALSRLMTRADASGTELALGLLARSRALVANDDAAENLYQEAIERMRGSRAIGELGRAHMLYGEWLRRQRRRRDAREELRTAYRLFTSIGAEPFADRARAELLATGEQVRKRKAGSPDPLTPQQAQIARLVSEGASNSEVAAHLFISPATVAYHLRNVYRQLGVTSRTGLALALRKRDES